MRVRLRSSEASCSGTFCSGQHLVEVAAAAQGVEPLETGAGEALLLHGTKPAVVASILQHSLDPAMAHDGLFGKGAYFAEVRVRAGGGFHVEAGIYLAEVGSWVR